MKECDVINRQEIIKQSVWAFQQLTLLPAPCVSECYIKIKINLNFYTEVAVHKKPDKCLSKYLQDFAEIKRTCWSPRDFV